MSVYMKAFIEKVKTFYRELISDPMGVLFLVCLFFFLGVAFSEPILKENDKLKMEIAVQKDIVRIQAGMLSSMAETLDKQKK